MCVMITLFREMNNIKIEISKTMYFNIYFIKQKNVFMTHVNTHINKYTMDSLWRNLPEHLVDHVCNKLASVHSYPFLEELKEGHHIWRKICNDDNLDEFLFVFITIVVQRDVNITMSTEELWNTMNTNEKFAFYRFYAPQRWSNRVVRRLVF